MPPSITATQSKKYDLVFIFGPDTEEHTVTKTALQLKEEIKKAKAAGLRCKVIGNGIDNISPKMLQELEDKIDSSTSININMHGTIKKGDHFIYRTQGTITSTKLLFQILSSYTDSNTPLHINLWSCHSGAAAKDVVALPENSSFIACSPDKETADALLVIPSIHRAIQDRVANKDEYRSHPQRAFASYFANEAVHTPTTLTFAVCENRQAKTFSSRPPDNVLCRSLRLYWEGTLTDFNSFLRTECPNRQSPSAQELHEKHLDFTPLEE